MQFTTNKHKQLHSLNGNFNLEGYLQKEETNITFNGPAGQGRYCFIHHDMKEYMYFQHHHMIAYVTDVDFDYT